MKKAVNKSLLACVTSFLLLFSCMFVGGDTVHAVDNGNTIVLGTMDACYADEDFKSYLAENGVEVEAGDMISLIQNFSATRSLPTTELQVIQNDFNDAVTIHTLIGYDETDGEILQSDIPVETNGARTTKSLSFKYKSNTITLTISATYNVDSITIDGYARAAYRPMSSSVKYTKTSSATATVTSIDTTFTTAGALYSLTTNSVTNDSYTYVIENTVYDPVASRTYTQSRNMTSNLRIIYTNGGWNEGPWMSYVIRFSDGSSGAQDVSMS